jgi:hypothetical protein
MDLVIADTAQIQQYAFGSNRLRENIAGSHLVAQATGRWFLDTVCDVASKHNIQNHALTDAWIDDGLDAMVLYSGGGNAVVLFRASDDHAGKFIRALSRKVLTQAPGLQLVLHRHTFDPAASLAQALDTAMKELARVKRARTPSAPLLGLGVTRKCASTELPAVTWAKQPDGDLSPVSAEIAGKLSCVRPRSPAADDRLAELVPPPEGCEYPAEFDDLGRTAGEFSYLGVVHPDGDGMGSRFQAVGKAHPNPSQNRDFVVALRALSVAVQKASLAALNDTVAVLPRKPGQPLPFRPIVFGGDDVVFVCDGRLALALALRYLGRFEYHAANLPDGKGKATASAGVAIVKIHYPFARAYALAVDLCCSAKSLRREIRRQRLEWQGSCIDWHFAHSGLTGNIDVIRDREYAVSHSNLTLRPVTVDDNNPIDGSRSWGVIKRGLEAFRGADWKGRRNKLKALREVLRQGPVAVEQYRARFNDARPLPNVYSPNTNWPLQGWQGERCGYFDALELADWYQSLMPIDNPEVQSILRDVDGLIHAWRTEGKTKKDLARELGDILGISDEEGRP